MKVKTMSNSPYLLLILATLFWGGNYALGKAVSGSFPPMTLSYLRWFIALLILLPLCLDEIKEHWQLLSKHWFSFAILGTTGILGYNMCVYLALQYTTAINASLINSFAPAYVALLSVIIIKETLGSRQWLGIVISFIGAGWIIFQGQLQNLLSITFNKGDLIMLLAVFLWGIYSLELKKSGRGIPSKFLLTASIFLGLILTTPLIVFEGIQVGTEWIYNLKHYHYLSLLYFGIFPTILAYLFFNKAMLEVGPSRATVFLNFVVVFASIFGIVFLKEQLLSSHIIGGALIIGGVSLTLKKVPIIPNIKQGESPSLNKGS